MFYFLFLAVLAGIIAVFIYLSVLNPSTVDIHFTKEAVVSMSLPEILLFSFLSGMLLMALGTMLREGRKAFRTWKESRLLKKVQQSDELYHRGVEHFLKGNFPKAAALFSEALERNPHNIKAYLRQAEVHSMMGEHPDAIKVLNRGRQLDVENLEILFALSDNTEAVGDMTASEEILKKILSLDEENREALKRLRDIYEKRPKWEAAYRVQKTIARLAKGTSGYSGERKTLARLKYGYAVELVEKKEPDKALKKLRDVVRLDKGFVPAHVLVGDILEEQGESTKAEEVWEEAYKGLAHAVFLIRIEDLFMKKEEPETLVNFYRRLVEESPQDITLRLFFVKLCLRLEMIEDAQDQMSYIESHGKAIPFYHHLQGELHMRRQRFPEAAAEFRRASGIGKPLVIPFICENCREETILYSAQCPSCKAWNTLVLKAQDDSFVRTQPLVSV